mmetsp:Transcript_12902/g.46367  ORF Transcript_12902/g.46367 Transcript_12902/m.46367 type:complete len:563 (-) Transcript_12902:351-2039(-)
MHLALQHVHVAHRVSQHRELALEIPELDLQNPQLVQTLAVLNLPLVQDALLYLDLLVQQRELVVASDELRPEDVAVVDDDVVLLLLPRALLIRLVDDVVQLLHLRALRADGALRLFDILQRFVELEPKRLFPLLHLHVVKVLLHHRQVFRADLLLELLDLVVHDLKLALHLENLVLRLEKVLAVRVAVRPRRLVQVLLLLQPVLAVADALLKVDDGDLANLHLLERAEIPRRRVRRLPAVLLPLLLQLEDHLRLLLRLHLVPLNLLLQRLPRVLVHLDEVALFHRRALRLRLELGEDVAFALELVLLLHLRLRLLPLRFDLPLELRDRALQVVAVALRLALLLLDALQLRHRGVADFPRAQRVLFDAAQLRLSRLELRALRAVLRHELRVRSHLLLELGRQLLQLLVQRAVLLLRALRRASLFLKHALELRRGFLRLFDRVRLRLDVVLLVLELRLELRELLVEALLLARLALALEFLRLHLISQLPELVLQALLRALRRSQPLGHLRDFVPQRHDLVHLRVSLRRERFFRGDELLHGLVHPRGHRVRASLDDAPEVGDLQF